MVEPNGDEAAFDAREHDDTPSLSALPAELLQEVLSYLGPFDLSSVAQCSRRLKTASYDDQLWHRIVNDQLHKPISDSFPLRSFRDLYIAHHPRWFMTKKRIWFADSQPNGKLLIVRYDETRGRIVANVVVARRGTHGLSFWEKDPEVIIHSFEPQVSLELERPVLKLDVDNPEAIDPPYEYLNEHNNIPETMYGREALMNIHSDSGLYSSFMLCRTLPEAAIGLQTEVWPPLRFPATSRTRNSSHNYYTSTGHRPSRLSEVSENTFRIRKWVEYTGRRFHPSSAASGLGNSLSATLGINMPYFATGGINIRMPEDIATFSSLPEWYYTPTPRKPWQGIWCGDYSGHGCEFLVIHQPDKDDETPLPPGMEWLVERWARSARRASTASSAGSFVSAMEDLDTAAVGEGPSNSEPPQLPVQVDRPVQAPISPPLSTETEEVHTGRLEAIKLTGDPNIPRAEHTFIAPDIGPEGFIRTADEALFRGARVVRSAGHIAGRGFRQDQYISSQLFLISHDRLAQFWEAFGHISYYQRVDLDALVG